MRLAVARAIDHLGPPLQADFARQGRVRDLTHTRQIGGKGIDSVQRRTPVGWSKQRCDEAIAVGGADQIGAIGECILHARNLPSIRPR
jgi:hypothetical protein